MMRADRQFVRAACLIVVCLLLWPLPFLSNAPRLVAQLSPFVAVCDSITLRSVGIGTGLGLILAAAGILRRRWFCRWVCPVGFLLDGASHIGLKRSAWWSRCPPLGKYAALLTIAGSIVLYPFFLWMDPLAIFSSSFAMRAAGGAMSGILSGLGLGLLLILSLTSGALWCARVCPLGGLMDLLASLRNLFSVKRDSSQPDPVPILSRMQASGARRSFLLVLAGAGIALLSRRLGAARGETAPLRPPGAAAESEFAGLCLRCCNCLRACPSRIIEQDAGQAGILGLLAPVIRFKDTYCLENCSACTQVCPSGALESMDLPQKRKYVIGEALVDLSLCVLALGVRDCDACVRACPFGAIRIHWDEDNYAAYPIVEWEKCNGCGACETVCPAPGDKAIRVWKRIDG